MTLTISTAHRHARLQASIDFADTGVANSQIRLYDAADTLLVSMVLAKPCGSIVSDAIVLEQADPSGDQITTGGSAVWAIWVNGDDEVVAEGDVTDTAGDGPFKVSGTTGTLLYAGAFAILGLTALG